MRRLSLLLLTIALGAAAVPGCGLVGGDDHYTLTARFPRAVSVFPSSDVRVLGLPAGEVTEVAVDGGEVRIEMRIPSDVAVPVDATAQIVPQSLIGERYIQITPAFQDGMEAAQDGDEIERTVIPVEPDEALASIKEFLDSLDPDGLGDLVGNLAEGLEGNGAALNDTLGSLSELVATFARNDDVLLRIVESFDQLTATLVTREAQLGEVLDAFAAASQVLADERESIGELVSGLADLSQTGLELVGKHAGELRTDIQTLADAAATIDANLASVTQLLEGGDILAEGLLGAFNPDVRAIDLRNNFSPLVTDLLGTVLPGLGLPPICVPVPVLACDPVSGQSTNAVTATISTSPATPVGSLLSLLGQPTAQPADDASATRSGPSWLDGATETLLGLGG
ncbi:MAG: MCE family protein [Acidimicrobiales bacterium]